MPDSKRETIVLAFIALMKTITTANDYEIEIGANIFRGIRSALEESEMPGMIVNEGSEPSSQDIGKVNYSLSMDLHTRFVLGEGENFYKVGNKALADIKKAMSSNRNLGGLATDTTLIKSHIGMGEEDPEKPKSLIVGVDADIVIKYRTSTLDPYS